MKLIIAAGIIFIVGFAVFFIRELLRIINRNDKDDDKLSLN
jgi:hypothetical protein